MGQENTKVATGERQNASRGQSKVVSARKPMSQVLKARVRIQCDGLLKLRTTPFRNSIEIQTQSELLFLEQVEMTLKTLLQTRLNTNKLFMLEDIERLIESLTFTLAFLQEKGVTYGDISPENIFYDGGVFKLLPNELIEATTYQKLKAEEDTYPSPELLIGLKLGEEDIEDEDILQKCNVFTLGMVLLEVTTLLPSSDCYDLEGYQILDVVLRERILLVEEYYGDRIARIIANMLDYDYNERMNLKELSIWVNRELQQVKTHQEPEPLTHSIVENRQSEKFAEIKSSLSHNGSVMDKSSKRLNKNNSVYMGFNRQAEGGQREERNRIYVGERNQNQQMNSKIFIPERTVQIENRGDVQIERNPSKNFEKFINKHAFQEDDSFKPAEGKKHELRHPNPYCDEFKFPKEERFEKEVTKRVSKEPVNPYRNYCPEPQEDSSQFEALDSKRSSHPLKELRNQYYPKIQDVIQGKSEVKEMRGESGGENGAISRIKEEIVKSRRLLEEFRRSEGLKF